FRRSDAEVIVPQPPAHGPRARMVLHPEITASGSPHRLERRSPGASTPCFQSRGPVPAVRIHAESVYSWIFTGFNRSNICSKICLGGHLAATNGCSQHEMFKRSVSSRGMRLVPMTNSQKTSVPRLDYKAFGGTKPARSRKENRQHVERIIGSI